MSGNDLSKVLKSKLSLEMFMAAIGIGAAVTMAWNVLSGQRSTLVVLVTGCLLAMSLLCIVWLRMDPDSVKARQTAEVLELARKTYTAIQEGRGYHAAQQICELLLPKTAAIAVAITDREMVLGYAGFEEVHNPVGHPITTTGTYGVIEKGETRVMLTPDEIGFPFVPRRIKAAIVVPLKQGRDITGTLKFYYRGINDISESQVSLAEGFGDLICTQMAAEALESQSKLATSMELKALQAQINPHFLFNTINTISSFIRTDPKRARLLLREFATFYRSTLEETDDLVALEREVRQTQRYFQFEEARFGEDRLRLEVEYEEEMGEMLIPAFMIQPLVENAVRHARPAEGLLTIRVGARFEAPFFILSVCDDGVGMTEEQRQALEASASRQKSETGLGIAMKNVHDRVEGYFGPDSHMEVISAEGEGTTINLYMNLESEHLRSFMQAKQQAQVAASSETISAGEVRSMAAVAEKSDQTGVSTEIKQALGSIDGLG